MHRTPRAPTRQRIRLIRPPRENDAPRVPRSKLPSRRRRLPRLPHPARAPPAIVQRLHRAHVILRASPHRLIRLALVRIDRRSLRRRRRRRRLRIRRARALRVESSPRAPRSRLRASPRPRRSPIALPSRRSRRVHARARASRRHHRVPINQSIESIDRSFDRAIIRPDRRAAVESRVARRRASRVVPRPRAPRARVVASRRRRRVRRRVVVVASSSACAASRRRRRGVERYAADADARARDRLTSRDSTTRGSTARKISRAIASTFAFLTFRAQRRAIGGLYVCAMRRRCVSVCAVGGMRRSVGRHSNDATVRTRGAARRRQRDAAREVAARDG